MQLPSLILLSLVALRASTAPVAGNEDYGSVEYKHEPEYSSYGEAEYSKGYGNDKSYDGDASYYKESYYVPHRESYNKGYDTEYAPTYYKRGDEETSYYDNEYKGYGDDKSYGESDYSTGYYSKEYNYAPHRESYGKGYETKYAPTYYKRGDDESSYYGNEYKVEYGHEESKEYGDDKSYGDYSAGYYSKESNYAPHHKSYNKGYETYSKSD
ncbi:hypothetical protein HDU98_006652 [Podochytrium sp. JEL0797]|nr:hypothetical protein HDU98_006652 [Podochytrium sp. JEL0797]